jgi:hypothetical protein
MEKLSYMIRTPPMRSPRAEYRLRRAEKVDKSAALSDEYPKLKTLKVAVEFFDPTGASRHGGMKCTVNLAHGKALFWFNCVNGDCVGGDYDLTKSLAEAVAAKRKVAEGEIRCKGTRHNKERKEDKPCQCLLRYKLNLGY